MIDLNNVEKYKENNRIEAKKALGGLPKSIWETYSAFANALGGVILLGVEEYKDKSFHVVDLPDPEKMVKEFWEIANDPDKVSVNILSKDDVFIQTAEGKHFIVINVPRAGRLDKPVYVGGDIAYTYRRNGEGDYKCSREEYEAMVRDASRKSYDMRLADNMDMNALNMESIKAFRESVIRNRPGQIWEQLSLPEFLLKAGALAPDRNGRNRPTFAGLLMFGKREYISVWFEDFHLTYLEPDGGFYMNSDDGNIINVWNFHFRVCERFESIEDEEVRECAKEAFLNCLVNADYPGNCGIAVSLSRKGIVLSNPGSFRIGLDSALSGGRSDVRNMEMLHMFNLVRERESAGRGIPHILHAWKERGWKEPEFTENFNPDEIVLYLSFEKEKRKSPPNGEIALPEIRDGIVDYLMEHIRCGIDEICRYMGISQDAAEDAMKRLIEEDIVTATGSEDGEMYCLKS